VRRKREDDEGKDAKGGRGGGGEGVTEGGRERRGAKIGKVDEKRVKAVRVC
jgi:hypothetical protein